jgi:hypothetical protein
MGSQVITSLQIFELALCTHFSCPLWVLHALTISPNRFIWSS